MHNIKLIKPLDILLIAVVCLFCGLSLLTRKSETSRLVATVYVNGRVQSVNDLSDASVNRLIRLDCTPAVSLKIENSAISFEKADCRDKLCVAAGELKKDGDTAACLPAGVVVRVDGDKTERSDIDILAF